MELKDNTLIVKISLINESNSENNALAILANRWGLKQDKNSVIALVLTSEHLEIRNKNEPKIGGIWVDFVNGPLAYRRRFGGGRREVVAKSVGIKGNYFPDVVDATAGLGRDAFTLAAIGCRVKMLERNPVAAALLEDGLRRGYQNKEIGSWLRNRLTLIHTSSLTMLKKITPAPDVVYLDPMYPHRRKSALVKKEMQIFQSLIGIDKDTDTLLLTARHCAKKRIVVKRCSYEQPLAGIPPQSKINTKKHRFDIYLPLKK